MPLSDPLYVVCLLVSALWPATAAFVVWDVDRRRASGFTCLLWWLTTLVAGPVALGVWLAQRQAAGPPAPTLQAILDQLQDPRPGRLGG